MSEPQYKTIVLFDLAKEFSQSTLGDRHVVEGLSHINFFVGPNNSGKSRFLRGLFKADRYHYVPTNIDLSKTAQDLRGLRDFCVKTLPAGVVSVGAIHPERLGGFADKFELLNSGSEITFEKMKEMVKGYATVDYRNAATSALYFVDPSQLRFPVEAIRAQATELLKSFEGLEDSLGAEKRVYIPVLRGLRPMGQGDAYSERTALDYKIDVTSGREIFTGLGLYSFLERKKSGSPEERKLVKEYESFLSAYLFEGESVELIARHGSDTVHLNVGGRDDRAAYSLGDGIQSIIMLTFLPFVEQQRGLFFIEEPDLFLHPAMQRKFMEILVRHPKFRKHQFFFSSHSNHILDMTTDYPSMSVYLFRRNQKNHHSNIRLVSHRDRNILHEVGARSSSVFLTNATVWVEGMTDRLYLREFLQTHLLDSPLPINPREDTHYSIVELGGNNLVHFNFSEVATNIADKINILNVCSRSFVIIDGDNSGKGNRVKELRESLKDSFYIFDSKEIENLLPASVICAIVNSFLARTKDKNLRGRKLDSGQLNEAEYQKEGVSLGFYLDGILGRKFFASDSGSLNRKTEFCARAVAWMQENPEEWAMTRPATDLASSVISFINGANNL